MQVRSQLIRAIRMVGVVTVPSAVALFFFGPLITEVLYMGVKLRRFALHRVCFYRLSVLD
jgi:peptidoglycan biosynthesis protein MviN/MurJ (putative lipid II flippase)